MANEIPVYLFVGFLESGKTKFIQETFEDPNLTPATRPFCWSARRAKRNIIRRSSPSPA